MGQDRKNQVKMGKNIGKQARVNKGKQVNMSEHRQT